ncbi:MAG: phosphoribulokinase [Halorhodospira halophila]|uniref:phosphoribulokinase n=1 Tax=Halorhodospira halophila TaxID=1053 RepID=UPI0026EB3367|nr:phosphoribulokinase [Halorhodospira halophila]MCC3751175.1 phosphoribulokinase [Halorhodospira halophila]
MSEKHPIIAVTGSSGAGTSTVKNAFEHIFRREQVTPVVIEGDAFHRFNRQEMRDQLARAAEEGRNLSHFGPEANVFDELEHSFRRYGQEGICRRRRYLHSDVEAEPYGLRPGEFTDWEDAGQDSDLLFYEGLHGGVVTEEHNVAQHVDLLVGVVPIVNLEWIQKIHRDGAERGYTAEKTVDTILRRMPDYVNYVTPQFSRTDINFQRVPTVDTSNPFIARDVPTPDESFTVIRFRQPERFGIDFPYLLNMIPDSFMSRRNTMVVPGGKTGFAMELIMTPIIHEFVERSRKLKGSR